MNGLQVTLIIVLAMAVLVIWSKRRKPGEDKPSAAAPTHAGIGAPATQDAALIAVITAAVAAAMGSEGRGFVIRNVRRARSTPAWGRAGREEQIYSRM